MVAFQDKLKKLASHQYREHLSVMYLSFISCLVFAVFSLQSPVKPVGHGVRLAIKQNFPDPSFIEVDGIYYAFATSNGKQNIPMATSHDFVHWEMLDDHDALPKVPMWSKGDTWAPDVIQLVRLSPNAKS